MDNGLKEDRIFPDGPKEELAANRLARMKSFYVEEEIVFLF